MVTNNQQQIDYLKDCVDRLSETVRVLEKREEYISESRRVRDAEVPVKEYVAVFRLLAPVTDFEAARDYLLDDEDITRFLDDWLSIDGIIKIEWLLDDVQHGRVVLKTRRALLESELDEISDWVHRQCDEGLGSGFEQQSFSEDQPEGAEFIAAFDWNNKYRFEEKPL